MQICIDAGHGKGSNPSPCGFGYAEGTRMYEYSLMLGEELKKYRDAKGNKVSVTYTRKSIYQNPSLSTRALSAVGSDLLLSLHTNAAGDRVADGTDYAVVFLSIHDKGTAFAMQLAQVIANTMGTTQKAKALTKANDAGGADYYGILRYSKQLGIRCMLLEHSFHTDSRATKWLMNNDNLRKLAVAEAEVVAQEYHLKKEREEVRYNTLADLKADKKFGPAYLPTIEKLIKKGYLKGKGGSGDALIIDLSEDMARILVILDRRGIFG